jgi:hypothetical protein
LHVVADRTGQRLARKPAIDLSGFCAEIPSPTQYPPLQVQDGPNCTKHMSRTHMPSEDTEEAHVLCCNTETSVHSGINLPLTGLLLFHLNQLFIPITATVFPVADDPNARQDGTN